ncbi:unnamed protein product [Rotaria socialis]|uniref:Uncharacterized protein n=1 Tax=Rotaria socialis TaxID=392032 RepID=A0A820KMS1_9BILA|nr:unnamed protein product [Rotaria socialis]CAF4345984.1 unnamed protein product [Rotaria socialis]CAF4507421.1 unnamed protein product [Rotaria socialis]
MALSSVKIPKYLVNYYGWSWLVEHSFKKSTHGDLMKTNDIMRNLIVHGKQIFGYVDRGVSTKNSTEQKMKEAVDESSMLNITGDGASWGYGTFTAKG